MQIYLGILRSIKDAGGKLKKTHIVYKSNLTNTRVQPYLNDLLAKGFLTEENEGSHIFFTITDKGIDFLIEARKLKDISEAFGLPMY